MIAFITGLAEPVYGSEAPHRGDAAVPGELPRHARKHPVPDPVRSGDWITVITRATGTFTGEMTLPDGNVIPRRRRRST